MPRCTGMPAVESLPGRLGMELGKIVVTQAKSADGCLALEAAVGSVRVVAVDPDRQPVATFQGCLTGRYIGPLPECGLYEMSDFVVGSASVGFGSPVPDVQFGTGLADQGRMDSNLAAVYRRYVHEHCEHATESCGLPLCRKYFGSVTASAEIRIFGQAQEIWMDVYMFSCLDAKLSIQYKRRILVLINESKMYLDNAVPSMRSV